MKKIDPNCTVCEDGVAFLADENDTVWELACPNCIGYISGIQNNDNSFPIMYSPGIVIVNESLLLKEETNETST